MSDAIHIRKEGDWSTLCKKPLAQQNFPEDTPSVYGPALGWEGNATCQKCLSEALHLHRKRAMRASAMREVVRKRLQRIQATTETKAP